MFRRHSVRARLFMAMFCACLTVTSGSFVKAQDKDKKDQSPPQDQNKTEQKQEFKNSSLLPFSQLPEGGLNYGTAPNGSAVTGDKGKELKYEPNLKYGPLRTDIQEDLVPRKGGQPNATDPGKGKDQEKNHPRPARTLNPHEPGYSWMLILLSIACVIGLCTTGWLISCLSACAEYQGPAGRMRIQRLAWHLLITGIALLATLVVVAPLFHLPIATWAYVIAGVILVTGTAGGNLIALRKLLPFLMERWFV